MFDLIPITVEVSEWAPAWQKCLAVVITYGQLCIIVALLAFFAHLGWSLL